MKLHIITVGEPKLEYAKKGWDEYLKRLKKYHTVRTTNVPDKHNDPQHILDAAGKSYKVGLVINGKPMTSLGLADFLKQRELEAREVSFIIGGPDGLPHEVITACDFAWSLSALTFPHDLAMVVLLETLYRASTITAGHPYHR